MPVADPLPSLSVVISCRNSASTLAETLDAIAGQQYPAWWEVVVVDNGSTDATSAVAQSFADRLPHFSLLTPPEPGYQARGINHGIEHSKGEAVVFLDSDDLVGPDYLLHLGRALATRPFVGAKLDIDRLNPPDVRARRRPLQTDRIDTFCGYLPAVVGAAMAARRGPLEHVGGWDDRLPTQHDLDLSWRLSRAGYPATLVPEAVLHYRYRTGVRAIFEQEYGYGDGEVALYRKYRSAGLRRRGPRQLAAGSWQFALAVLRLPRPGGAARLATVLGINLGRLRGSIRLHTWYP